MWPNKGAAPQQPLRFPVLDDFVLLDGSWIFSPFTAFGAAVGELGALGGSTHHMKHKRYIVVFGTLVLTTAALLVYGFAFRRASEKYIHDNSEVMIVKGHALTQEQLDYVVSLSDTRSNVYLVLLGISNAIWLAGAIYFLRSLKRDDQAA